MSNLVSLLAAVGGGGPGLWGIAAVDVDDDNDDVSDDFLRMNNCLGSLSRGITFGFSFVDSLISGSISGDLGVGEAGVSSITISGDMGVSSGMT